MNELKVVLNRVETALKLLAINAELKIEHKGMKYTFFADKLGNKFILTMGILPSSILTYAEIQEMVAENCPQWISYYDEGEHMGWKLECEVLL